MADYFVQVEKVNSGLVPVHEHYKNIPLGKKDRLILLVRSGDRELNLKQLTECLKIALNELKKADFSNEKHSESSAGDS